MWDLPRPGLEPMSPALAGRFFFFFYFINLFILFIYFWLCWVFVAVRGLSLVAVSGGLLFVAVRGLLIAVASLLQSTGSRHAGFSSCGSQAQ